MTHTASSTIRYINPSYEDTPDASSTRHIYGNGMLMGTEVGNTLTHIHRDHLESTNVVTDSSGTPTEIITYHPYGDILSETLFGTPANTLFSDSVNPLWTSSSWNISTSTATSPVYEGSTSLRVSYATPWGGLAYTQSINTTAYSTLSLSFNIGTSSTPSLYLYATNASGTPIVIKDVATYIPGGIQQNTWHTLSIPLSDLGIQNYVGTLTINLESSLAIPLYIDAYSFKGTPTKERNQYIGQDFDGETGLSYLNARYYDSRGGQFLSQDPMFWSTNQDLMDPQTFNTYSYASNNPVNKKDPSGLATIKGSLQEIQKSFIGVLKNFIVLLNSKPLTREEAKNQKLPTIRSTYNSAKNTVNQYRNGNDAEQDAIIGRTVVMMGEIFVTRGKGRSVQGVEYTKSSLARGREEHSLYKVTENDQMSGFKEYTFANGRRADFVSIDRNAGTGIVFELKPFNPRSISQGNSQLDVYKTSASTDAFFQKEGITSWSTQLDTY